MHDAVADYDIPSFMADAAPQEVFGDFGKKKLPKVDPPPLEVTPLFISGSSDNRVDLVFFGDGCALYCCGILYGVEVAQISTQRRTNSLKTRWRWRRIYLRIRPSTP